MAMLKRHTRTTPTHIIEYGPSNLDLWRHVSQDHGEGIRPRTGRVAVALYHEEMHRNSKTYPRGRFWDSTDELMAQDYGRLL